MSRNTEDRIPFSTKAAIAGIAITVSALLIAGPASFAFQAVPDIVGPKAKTEPLARAVPLADAALANQDSQEKPKIKEMNTLPYAGLRIALIEDDTITAEGLVERLSAYALAGSTVDPYPNCEILIDALRTNIELNYNFYLVDNDLSKTHGISKGPGCTKHILELRPGAFVIGHSIGISDQTKKDFVEKGARAAFDKNDLRTIELIKQVFSSTPH